MRTLGARIGAVLLVLAALAALVYGACVVQGNMLFEQMGGTTYRWTPLEAGAFYAAVILGVLGAVLLGVGLIVRGHSAPVSHASV